MARRQLTDLAERSGLSLPTVHRLLRSLGVAGLVEQVLTRSGTASTDLVRLSERYLDRLPVLRAAAPYLVELRDSTKATVLAAIFARGWIVYVDRVDGDDAGGAFRESVRMRPALETAAGRLLAVPAGSVGVEGSSRNGKRAIVHQAIGSAGPTAPYVVLAADHTWAEVAVPVTSTDGQAGGSIVATGRSDRHTEKVLVEQVVIPTRPCRRCGIALARS